MGQVRAFAEGLWIVEGPQVSVRGFRYPTRAVLCALPDGGLLVWSPVALDDALGAEVATIGPVRHILAPNHLHHLSIGDWVTRWPEARVHGAPGLAAKRPDLTFDTELGDDPAPDWATVLDQVVVRGNKITTEVVLFHRASATVLVTDLMQQFDRGWFRGWRALIARLDLMEGTEPRVPRKFRAAFTDRVAARHSVARILDWPARRLIVAHGAPVETGARDVLKRGFRWLTG